MNIKKSIVMCVDDEIINRHLLRRLLDSDYDIIEAQSGNEAIQKLKENTNLPDIILLDVMMPGIDGYGTCSRIKSNPLTSHIPVIFITTHGEIEEQIKGFKLGAADYILKPFSPPIVEARIRTHLELKKQRDLLEKLNLTDNLTGIANRRKYEQYLANKWNVMVRLRTPLSLVMIDIDHFKQYNDNYGHSEGDHCLRQVAQAMQSALVRSVDLVARYGGEEFVAVLPGTGLSGAKIVAEKMRACVQNLNIPHEFSSAGKTVTVSIGLSSCQPSREFSAEKQLVHADQLLYQSKENGRNRVSSGVFENEILENKVAG